MRCQGKISMDVLKIIGRNNSLFQKDMEVLNSGLQEIITSSKFLVIGAAGSIGQSVTLELFKRNPKVLHAVDISENNLVELVRTIRSSLGYIDGDFQTFAIDCGSMEFEFMARQLGPYDYVFNLSALKHVRSEKDPYTLMRLIKTNILNTVSVLDTVKNKNLKNYFCVSTDKASNPVNLMGASKRIMEKFLMRESVHQRVSMARFANVAFSDGSLLHGFNQRILKKQPITAPKDVRRYFITPKESGELCIFSGLLGDNRDIFFPKMSDALNLEHFSDIAERFLYSVGYKPFRCDDEAEARERASTLISQGQWPVFFFNSDTTGEKDFEEFYTASEKVDLHRFNDIGIVKNNLSYLDDDLDNFEVLLGNMLRTGSWEKNELIELFYQLVPEFSHKETGKYLDGRM
jgi:FlaA1/EpsC-like NDP-sugar epimerase